MPRPRAPARASLRDGPIARDVAAARLQTLQTLQCKLPSVRRCRCKTADVFESGLPTAARLIWFVAKNEKGAVVLPLLSIGAHERSSHR